MQKVRVFELSGNSSLYGEIVDISNEGNRIFVQERGQSTYKVFELNSPSESWKSIGDEITEETADVRFSVFNSFGGNGDILVYSGTHSFDSTCLVYLKLDASDWQIGGKLCRIRGPFSNKRNEFSEVTVSKDGKVVVAVYETMDSVRSIQAFKFKDGEFIRFGDSIIVEYLFGWNLRLSENGKFLMVSGSISPDDSGTVKVFEMDIETSVDYSLDMNLQYELFPNPTSQFLSLKGKLTNLNSIIIFDSKGSLVEIHKPLILPINIAHLETGFYFVELKGDKEIKCLKMIKR